MGQGLTLSYLQMKDVHAMKFLAKLAILSERNLIEQLWLLEKVSDYWWFTRSTL